VATDAATITGASGTPDGADAAKHTDPVDGTAESEGKTVGDTGPGVEADEVSPDAGPAEEPPAAVVGKPPRNRRRRVLLAVLLSVALVAGAAGTALAVVNTPHPLSELHPGLAAELEDAQSRLADARTESAASLVEALGGSSQDWNRNRVYLPGVCAEVTAVNTSVDTARNLEAQAQTLLDGTGVLVGRQAQPDLSPVVVTAQDVQDLIDQLEAQIPVVVAAGQTATAEWMKLVGTDAVKSYTSAVTELTAAVAAAQKVLDGAKGKVTDQNTLTVLQGALDTARQALDTPGPTTPRLDSPASITAIWVLVDALTKALPDLKTAQQAVTDSNTAWQAEQDKKSKNNTSTSSGSGSNTTKPKPSVPNPKPKPAPKPAPKPTTSKPKVPRKPTVSASYPTPCKVNITIKDPDRQGWTVHIQNGSDVSVRSGVGNSTGSRSWGSSLCVPGGTKVWLT